MFTKNSEEEYILRYLANEENNLRFLLEHSYDSWAEPYLKIAAKRCSESERYSYFFLYHYCERHWAKQYLESAISNVAKTLPKYYMEEWADKYPEYIITAAYLLGDKIDK